MGVSRRRAPLRAASDGLPAPEAFVGRRRQASTPARRSSAGGFWFSTPRLDSRCSPPSNVSIGGHSRRPRPTCHSRPRLKPSRAGCSGNSGNTGRAAREGPERVPEDASPRRLVEFYDSERPHQGCRPTVTVRKFIQPARKEAWSYTYPSRRCLPRRYRKSNERPVLVNGRQAAGGAGAPGAQLTEISGSRLSTSPPAA